MLFWLFFLLQLFFREYFFCPLFVVVVVVSPVKDTVLVNDRWGSGDRCKHGGSFTCDDRYNPGTVFSSEYCIVCIFHLAAIPFFVPMDT